MARITVLSLGTVNFYGGEQQLDWTDWDWTPVGQSVRYALAGNQLVRENVRQGRPITLVAELPWAWFTAATADALRTLASSVGQSHILTLSGSTPSTYRVRFQRSDKSLVLTPLDQRREYFTGQLNLVEY